MVREIEFVDKMEFIFQFFNSIERRAVPGVFFTSPCPLEEKVLKADEVRKKRMK